MNTFQLLLLLLIYYLYIGVISWKFFTGAGRKAWEAFVPIYNIYVMIRIIERPWWWVILSMLPVVGNVMIVVILFELMHVYRLGTLKNIFLIILTLGLYLAYLNYTEKLKYQGRDIKNIRKHVSELGGSILFAIVAATVIRTFTFEAFTIPTPSMEKSLMVGDFLFVSKMHYGVRLPVTPVALPLVHSKIPFTDIPAYNDFIKFPLWRLPKFQEVHRNDPVVFNYPMHDDLPIDKREHYVKRCLATPGDTLKIVDRQVFVNGKANRLPDRANAQFNYYVRTTNVGFSPRTLKEKFDINYLRSAQQNGNRGAVETLNREQNFKEYIITIPDKQLEEFKAQRNVKEVIPINSEKRMSNYPQELPGTLRQVYQQMGHLQPNSQIFPNPANATELVYHWTRDNYGPIYIPAEGDEVKLTPKNYHFYRRIIDVYEDNDFTYRDGKFFINGRQTDSYTFEQDYYWMMGDNRHNSLDSRYWGYVPESHIVGKPVFIWMSFDKYADGFFNSFRTDRIFTTVNGQGERFHYFFPFIIVVVGIYAFNRYRKKKKSKKEA